uniref:Uncharacterized protein n=1 Tax=Panagrolaimus davidi TaxID=227884 RepID=A0A914PRM8_9BILA
MRRTAAAAALLVTFLTLFAVTDSTVRSKECAFTNSKKNSCLYFVDSKEKSHQAAVNYCFDKFNGQLPIIYKSYDEATEVMKRYFWWSESDMNVKQIRFGMTHRHRDKPEIYDYTFFNPLQYMGVDVDMAIWNRSFPDPDPKNITLTYEMYDDENFNRTE